MKYSSTPGFLHEASQRPINLLAIGALLMAAAPGEPTWVIGDPDTARPAREDGGSTLRQPGPFKFYAIRDDHPRDCDCGCGGGSIVTFLLPEEY